MKRFIIELAQTVPSISNPLWRLLYPRFFRRDEYHSGEVYETERQSTFETIYEGNLWHCDESRSGQGSTLVQTSIIRRRLPRLLLSLKAETLLDAPCGDFHWMSETDLPETVSYTGGDIVRPMISDLQSKFAHSKRNFRVLDIASDPLPASDVWLCRDVLFHLPNRDIFRAFANAKSSGIKYLLTTSFDFPEQNRDIKAGGFRFIDLQKKPFDLPPPIEYFDDFVFPEPPRSLCLWKVEDLPSSAPPSENI